MISWGWLKGHSLTKGTGEGLTAAMPVPQARVLQSNTSVQHKRPTQAAAEQGNKALWL